MVLSGPTEFQLLAIQYLQYVKTVNIPSIGVEATGARGTSTQSSSESTFFWPSISVE